MPAELPITDLKAAKAAVAHAQAVRKSHARRTDVRAKHRTQDLKLAQERIAEAMKPIRSAIGRFPMGPQTDAAEANRDIIYAVSRELQAERRKLWKMQQAGKRRKPQGAALPPPPPKKPYLPL